MSEWQSWFVAGGMATCGAILAYYHRQGSQQDWKTWADQVAADDSGRNVSLTELELDVLAAPCLERQIVALADWFQGRRVCRWHHRALLVAHHGTLLLFVLLVAAGAQARGLHWLGPSWSTIAPVWVGIIFIPMLHVARMVYAYGGPKKVLDSNRSQRSQQLPQTLSRLPWAPLDRIPDSSSTFWADANNGETDLRARPRTRCRNVYLCLVDTHGLKKTAESIDYSAGHSGLRVTTEGILSSPVLVCQGEGLLPVAYWVVRSKQLEDNKSYEHGLMRLN